MRTIILSLLLGSAWSEGSSGVKVKAISTSNRIVSVEDPDNGVVCYVAVEGIANWDIHGISCVKVKP